MMSEIDPVKSSHPLHRLSAHLPGPTPTANGVSRASDTVEVSETASLLAKLDQLPETREDLVNQVRREIESGNYLTPEKEEAALAGLLQDLLD